MPDLEERRERIEVDCPTDERARLAGAVPPMDGGEYVDADWVAARWADLNRAFADEIRTHRGPVAEWLRAQHPSWHAVGKVCLHLAENRGDEEHPFAFLATYAVRASAGGKVQHRPLARGLEASSARGDRQALLHLLVPLQRAAEQRPWLAELIDSGAIYQAMAWTPAEAHRFLQAIPAFEAAGLVVRVPDWWRPRHPPRPEVAVRVGEKKPSAVGMDALLDFSVAVALGDDKLTAAEVRQLLASSGGLVRLRGQWVELDRERLREVLAHWERVRREAGESGLSFLEGMRLLAGAARTEGAGPPGSRRPTRAATCAGRCDPIRKSAWRGSRLPRRCGSASAWPTTWGSARPSRCWDSCSCTSAARAAASRRICSWRRRRCSPTGRPRSSASRRRWRRSWPIPPLCPRASSPSWPAPISAARISSSPPTGRSRASRRSGAGSGRCRSSTRHRRSRTPGPGRRRR
ncbi:MAG: hypothetical protein DMD99_06420 [Candidatus Rokuibacteriota bacterium]|nr:MAG: hypothetical protein DMD99_06420 [Candidatus Rokubacteria bacterium]